jgi:soluble lytic murein transglycosylase-like protein
MKALPALAFRGALLMSFLMVLACLALSNSATLASTDPADLSHTPRAQTASSTSSEISPSNTCALSEKYPSSILQWCDLIMQHADENGLPPSLVAALIWQESGGNPTAYSASGAVGLMQVMPRDGIASSFMCINGPCFASRPATAELEDPEFNIEYGTRMLAGLLSRYQDMREALMRYGPQDVGYSYADKVLGIYERYRGE